MSERSTEVPGAEPTVRVQHGSTRRRAESILNDGPDSNIEELIEDYLADPSKVDVTAFVDQLLNVASENGAVGCRWESDRGVQFTVSDPSSAAIGVSDNDRELDVVYTLESPWARSVLRMLYARLGVLCQESSGRAISLYGDQAVIEQGDLPRRRWAMALTNTPERQEFLIERRS